MSSLPAMAEVFNGGADGAKNIALGLGSTVLGLTTALKSFTSVESGTRGVRKRWGKVVVKNNSPVVVEAGRHMTFIGVGSIETISTQDRSQNLEKLTIDREVRGELKQIEAISSVVWHVIDDDNAPFRALYMVDDLPEAVKNQCANDLNATLMTIDDDKIFDQEAVLAGVLGRCETPLYEWGVELKRFNIHQVSRSLGEMMCEAARIGSPSSPVATNALLAVREAS